MEAMGHLFDSCDKSHMDGVSVSTLIEAVRKEIGLSENGHGLAEKEDILKTVRRLLDPLDIDIAVDKATWIAAWQTQAESPKHKRTRDMTGGHVFSPMDIVTDGHAEDVSKHSYCFSPGSRSSSVEREPEEMAVLKQEIQQLKNTIRILKERWQNQEDALVEEQTEKQEQEEKFKEEINRLMRQIKILHKSEADLKSTLEICEREKLEVCNTVTQRSELDRQQKTLRNAEQQIEVELLNAEIEELNLVKENYEQEKADLQAQLEQQTIAHREQLKEYQNAIRTLTAEKIEMNFKISQLLLNKRDISARLDEIQFSSLQSELAEAENDTALRKNQLVVTHHAVTSSTPSTFHLTKFGNSLLNEMKAAGSLLDGTADLDCSFDDVQESPIHLFSNGDNGNRPYSADSAGSGHNSDAHQTFLQKRLFWEARNQEKGTAPDLRSDTDYSHRCTKISDTRRLGSGGDSKNIPHSHQPNQIKEDLGHNHKQQSEMGTQTESLSEAGNEKKGTALGLRRDTATQTEDRSKGTDQRGADQRSIPEKVDQYVQTHIPKCEMVTQTEFSSRVIRQGLVLRRNVDVQTDSNAGHPVKIPGQLRNQSTQTRIHKRKIRADSDLKKLTDCHKLGITSLMAVCQSRTQNNTDNVEPSSKSKSSRLNKPFVPGNAFKQTDLLQPSSSELESKKELVHSIILEGRLYTFPKPIFFLSRYRPMALLFLFLFLVMASTVVFTAAVLEEAAESGFLSTPFYGSVPNWIKWIVRPVIHVTQRTGHIPV